MSKKKQNRRALIIIIAAMGLIVILLVVEFAFEQIAKYRERQFPIQFLSVRGLLDFNDVRGYALRVEEEDGKITYFYFKDRDTLDKVTVVGGLREVTFDPNDPDWNIWQDRYQQTQAKYFDHYLYKNK